MRSHGNRFDMRLIRHIGQAGNRIGAVACLVSCLLLLAGCTPDVDCESCRPPELAVDEINNLGATITRDARPFPDSIGQRLDEAVFPTQVIGEISLYFKPKDDDLTVSLTGILNEELSSVPYNFTFSQLDGADYTEISPGSLINENSDSVGPYGGHLLRDASSSFLPPPGGNYVLSTSGQLRIPTTATHVELWYREDQMQERQLVRRVMLSDLYGWQQYFDIPDD